MKCFYCREDIIKVNKSNPRFCCNECFKKFYSTKEKEEKIKTNGEKSLEKLEGGTGIRCPRCHCTDLSTRNTLPRDGEIKRYKICRNCGWSIRTFERIG